MRPTLPNVVSAFRRTRSGPAEAGHYIYVALRPALMIATTCVALLLASAMLVAQGSGGLDPAKILKPLADEWPTYSGDYTGRRYSSLAQINQSTVKNLTLAFAAKVTGGPGAANPIDPEGPYGAKEAGQGPLLPIPPALCAAVHDALGVWIDEVPVTPEKVVEALRRKEKGEPARYGPIRFPSIPYPSAIKVDAPPPTS